MLVRDKIYINGAWVPSTGKGTLDVIDSATEEVFATIPEGTAEDVDKAVEAAAAAFPGWAATSREERAKLLTRIGEALGARTDEIAQVISHEVGMPMTLSGAIQVGPARRCVRRRRSGGRELPMGRRGRELPRRARAGRRRGRHHAVELPALPGRPQGGPVAGRRLHRRAEAERGGADQRVHPGRRHRRGRSAAGCLQPGQRRRPGRRGGDRRPPQGRHGLLHRLHPGRTACHGAGGRGHQAGLARAGRQVGQHPARRRRLRHRRPGRALRLLHELRARPARPSPACSSPGTGWPRWRRWRSAGTAGFAPGDPFEAGKLIGPLVSAVQRDRVRRLHQEGDRRGGQAHRRRRRAPRKGSRTRDSSCSRPSSPRSPRT